MKSIQLIFITTATLILSTPSFALSTDRDQPANIEADDIEFDFKKGIRTYKKNVYIVQGTLRIKADSLITTYDGNELSMATATGSLAQFKQRPDDKPDDVEGWAEKIVVDQKNNIITLQGQAALKQGADTARGETIIYNMATDTLKVQGGANLKQAGEDGQAAPEIAKEQFDPPPAPIAQSAPVKSDNTDDKSGSTTDETKEVETEPVVPETVPSGRSRLIIQPK